MSSRTPTQWLGGVLAAVSFAALTQILTLDVPTLSSSLSYAVLIFSISIPLSVFIFMAPGMLKWEPPFTWSKLIHGILIIVFAPASLSGFVAIFYHFGALHGTTFLVSSLLTYLLFLWIRCDIRTGKLHV